MSTVVQLTGEGRVSDRSEVLAKAFNNAIDEHGQGLPVVVIIGVLELVKMDVINWAVEDGE